MSDDRAMPKAEKLKDYRDQLEETRIKLLLRLQEDGLVDPESIFYKRLLATERLLLSVEAALKS